MLSFPYEPNFISLFRVKKYITIVEKYHCINIDVQELCGYKRIYHFTI